MKKESVEERYLREKEEKRKQRQKVKKVRVVFVRDSSSAGHWERQEYEEDAT